MEEKKQMEQDTMIHRHIHHGQITTSGHYEDYKQGSLKKEECKTKIMG